MSIVTWRQQLCTLNLSLLCYRLHFFVLPVIGLNRSLVCVHVCVRVCARGMCLGTVELKIHVWEMFSHLLMICMCWEDSFGEVVPLRGNKVNNESVFWRLIDPHIKYLGSMESIAHNTEMLCPPNLCTDLNLLTFLFSEAVVRWPSRLTEHSVSGVYLCWI